jgi:hypothetical protein
MRPGRGHGFGIMAALVLLGAVGVRAAEDPKPDWPQHVLTADRWWWVNLPEGKRVDASGLLRRPSGEWWTVNDQNGFVWRMTLGESTNVADLVRVPDLITPEQVGALTGQPRARLDAEGLAQDAEGRVYISEEERRWILRWDPGTRKLERLPIDWSSVMASFHPTDRNASFEGVTVGGDRLWVANERQIGRLIEVDLKTLRVMGDFAVAPAETPGEDTHYTDLAWFDDSLWVLLRDVRKVLRVDVKARKVTAEFDFAEMETRRAVAYGPIYSPGLMEGLWVDAEFIWLLSDNNGLGRRVNPSDARPTLFRCPRPDCSAPK